MKRLQFFAILTALALAPAAFGYYHFVRYTGRTGSFNAIVQRFDIASLPGNAVPVLITEPGPDRLANGDSWTSMVSQIVAATKVWDEVRTSDLRLTFGGLVPAGAEMKGPRIEVLFDDIGPGLIALGGPTTQGEIQIGPSGAFAPIIRSVVILRNDFRDVQGRAMPSWSERFFLSVVHEFGHAIGLQHTWTSSVMSTEITRATTKGVPLSDDDIAGISALYPTPAFEQQYGSITGRVTTNGTSIPLASVVALSPTGPAVAALTAPDGTYRIAGLLPGSYVVYAHTLPPALSGEPQPVNLVLPSDPAGNIAPGPAFELQFFPNSRTPVLSVTLEAGATAESINFAVQRRNSVAMHSGQTYSFYTTEAVKPAHLLLTSPTNFLVMYGYGMSTGTAPVSGLTASVVGASEGVSSLRAYSPSPAYLQLDLQATPFSRPGPRHLLFSANNENYLLPSAFRIVSQGPPSLTSAEINADQTITITGSNLTSQTSIWFDGVPGTTALQENGDLIATPPPGPAFHKANLVAINPDGQSSLFVQGTAPVYSFDNADLSQVALSNSTMQAGTEGMIELNTSAMNLKEGLVRIGFGTSDVAVRRIWVTGPNRILANVSVSGEAVPGATQVTVLSGLQSAVTPGGLLLAANSGRQPYVSIGTLPSGFAPGSTITLPIRDVQDSTVAPAISVNLGDHAVPVFPTSAGLASFQIPSNQPAGPIVVRIHYGNETVLPFVIHVDPPAPVLTGITTLSGAALNATSPASPGDTLVLQVDGLSEGGFKGDLNQLRLTSGTSQHAITSVSALQERPNTHALQFVVNPATSSSQVLTLTLSLDGRSSNSVVLPIR